MTSITISLEQFACLSQSTQIEILGLFQDQQQAIACDTLEVDGELTRKQVSNLLNGLSDKSRNVLKVIVKQFENDHIHHDQLLEKLDMVGENLTGVWSGITKRCRNVANDQEFNLIQWNWSEDEDCYIGIMHPTTYSHLADYFK